jgi:hypothetical protein
MAIERALQQFLYVQMAKELKNKLLSEAKEYVIKVRLEKEPFGGPIVERMQTGHRDHIQEVSTQGPFSLTFLAYVTVLFPRTVGAGAYMNTYSYTLGDSDDQNVSVSPL